MAHRPEYRRQERRGYDIRRRDENPWRGWYSLAVWRKDLRPAQLAKQPLCERCLARGLTVLANVVNHRNPHRGDWGRFVDPANHESTCEPCHNGQIQAEEKSRFKAVGVDGWPIE